MSEKSFKDTVKDRVYEVKFNEEWGGRKIEDIMEGLRDMFKDVLNDTCSNLSSTDLVRVAIHHESLGNALVVAARKISDMSPTVILDRIQNLMNSQKNLAVDESFRIQVGTIDLPKGGVNDCQSKRRYMTCNEDKKVKRSIVEIVTFDDQMCLARAIAVCWVHHIVVNQETWEAIIEDDIKRNPNMTKCELVMKHRVAPKSYYKDVRKPYRYVKDSTKPKEAPTQRNLAMKLCEKAGLPSNRMLTVADIPCFEKALGVEICIVHRQSNNKCITPPSEHPDKIYVYLDDKHFDAIVMIKGFFTKSKFCIRCNIPYEKATDHICTSSCPACHRSDCFKHNEVRCSRCNQTCRSTDCFDLHKVKKTCQTTWMCIKCEKHVKHDDSEELARAVKEHNCGEFKCPTCQMIVTKPHECFTRADTFKDTPLKALFFDFEARQDKTQQCDEGYESTNQGRCGDCEDKISKCLRCFRCKNCNDNLCGRKVHIPNLVISHTVCEICKDEEIEENSKCVGCGTRCPACAKFDRKSETFVSDPCEATCGYRRTLFQGDDTLNQFGNFLFTKWHSKFTVIAHNMKGYDGHFLLKYCLDKGLQPETIFAGSKIMSMTVKKGLDIKIIDSLNFLPMKLAALPKCFGIEGIKKGYFPHYFNTEENQNYKGMYPEPSYYGADFMGGKERSQFYDWYESLTYTDVFDFRKEIVEYCEDDVSILRKACVKFRDIIISLTGEFDTNSETGEEIYVHYVDPFDCTTIAGVCMKIFRTVFMTEIWSGDLTVNEKTYKNVELVKKRGDYLFKGEYVPESFLKNLQFKSSDIAFLPHELYNNSDQFSNISIKWLEWVKKTSGKDIQHALNKGEKEIRVNKHVYKVDGYFENREAKAKEVFEYHGCIYHGCKECFPRQRYNAINGDDNDTLAIRYNLTNIKKHLLEREGYTYTEMWDCQFTKLLKTDQKLQEFTQELEERDFFQSRLDPRDTFFGGRTNACQLYKEAKDGEKIMYYDFTSLYPFVNKYERYPVGHPEIIRENFKDIKEYFGLAKVKVLAPDNLYHPVLPFRHNSKLKFALCKTCAEKENKTPCKCSDAERAFIGSWCTPEIIKAMEKGYKILKIYEVYHWDNTSCYDKESKEGGIFSKYVDAFLKIKQEASGFPENVVSDKDKENYIKDYKKNEGITMEENNIEYNAGLRSVAKLALNPLWGKYSQRHNLARTAFFGNNEAVNFFKLLNDQTKNIKDFCIVNENSLFVEYDSAEGLVVDNKMTNIFIGTFTTCWARLKLYNVLDTLGERCLYYDTDSVFFICREGEYIPKLGNYLGDLTNEIPESEGGGIRIFVSCGPKNYAYVTLKGTYCCKVRGFSLNFTNSKIINFEALRDIVINDNDGTRVVTNPSKICRMKDHAAIYNREESKQYRLVYTKRIVIQNYNTLPYGTKTFTIFV